MHIRELKTLPEENKIHFRSYWDKKKLTALANEQDLLPQIELEKEKVGILNTSRTRGKLV